MKNPINQISSKLERYESFVQKTLLDRGIEIEERVFKPTSGEYANPLERELTEFQQRIDMYKQGLNSKKVLLRTKEGLKSQDISDIEIILKDYGKDLELMSELASKKLSEL